MRLFHGGVSALDLDALAAAQAIDDADRERIKRELTGQHRLSSPARSSFAVVNGETKLKVPPMFWQYIEKKRYDGQSYKEVIESSKHTAWQPGSVTLSLPGHGFWVCFPNSYIDVPSDIPLSVIHDACPHLLTEEEAIKRGIASPPATPKVKR